MTADDEPTPAPNLRTQVYQAFDQGRYENLYDLLEKAGPDRDLVMQLINEYAGAKERYAGTRTEYAGMKKAAVAFREMAVEAYEQIENLEPAEGSSPDPAF